MGHLGINHEIDRECDFSTVDKICMLLKSKWSIYLSIYLSHSVHIDLSHFAQIYLSIYLPINLSLFISLSLSCFLSQLNIYLSIYLSISAQIYHDIDSNFFLNKYRSLLDGHCTNLKINKCCNHLVILFLWTHF